MIRLSPGCVDVSPFGLTTMFPSCLIIVGPITLLTRADGTPVYNRGPFPADLMADVTKSSTDGELFGFISGGGRQGLSARLRGRDSTSPMPEFQKLLTEQERWELVKFLRSRIGR